MKTHRTTEDNLKKNRAPIITIVILFATIIFTAAVSTGCCGFGWQCGGPYRNHGGYYDSQGGWHNNDGGRNGGRYRENGGGNGWGH